MSDDGWVAVMPFVELADRTPHQIAGDGHKVLLVRDGDRLFAIGDTCSHQGAPLHRGRVAFGGSLSTVSCPVHGSLFDLASGAVRRGPAMSAVPSYDVRVNGGMVQIRDRS
jgi:nitrite reductase/ring-hydroxylating ferredoxin subunit